MFSFKRLPQRYQEVLKQLDDCNKTSSFPVLDNGYVYLADVRMSVFANQNDWAIIIKTVGYNPRAWKTDGFDTCLYSFGNAFINDPRKDNMDFIFPIDDGLSDPLLLDNNPEIINPSAKDLKIRGNLIPIPESPEIYAMNGIMLENPPTINAFEFLRLLSATHRDLLLATETELSALFSRSVPLILQLQEWHHPDISGGEKPSKNETFMMIAKLIDKLDTSIYDPSKSPNTHWSNWANGGAL